MRAAQAETERKFTLMADAMKQMAEAQAEADRKMAALIDIVQDRRNGKSET